MTKKNLMSVTVKLFADLTKYGPNKSETLLSEGSSINSILKKYNIPTEKMKLIILVNGRPVMIVSSFLRMEIQLLFSHP